MTVTSEEIKSVLGSLKVKVSVEVSPAFKLVLSDTTTIVGSVVS